MQSNFFDGADDPLAPKLLEGFRYRQDLLSPHDESALVERVRELPFREFEFHGYLGKRRVVSFGWRYDFAGRQLRKAEDVPEFLFGVRALAASFAGLEPAAMQHVLVTEYAPGAGIGWHRDKKEFGQVVAISLLSPCVLRFRRKRVETGSDAVARPRQRRRLRQSLPILNETAQPTKLKREWERVNVLAEPRSAYHLNGPARSEWEHSILRVESLRYSITFRNMHDSEVEL